VKSKSISPVRRVVPFKAKRFVKSEGTDAPKNWQDKSNFEYHKEKDALNAKQSKYVVKSQNFQNGSSSRQLNKSQSRTQSKPQPQSQGTDTPEGYKDQTNEPVLTFF
jgi:hypothetical protein